MAGRFFQVIFCLALMLASLLGTAPAFAFGDPPGPNETVTQYLTPDILQSLFPGAERIGEVGGKPVAATVYKAGKPIGYIFSTWDVTRSRGFADRPLVLLVGLGLDGHITRVKLVRHAEAIGILGLRDEDFIHFPDQFTGYDVRSSVDVVRGPIKPPGMDGSLQPTAAGPGASKVDAIAHATTSSVFMSDAILRGARMVARSRGILVAAHGRSGRVDVDRFDPATWNALEGTGAIAHLHLATKDVLAKLQERGAEPVTGGNRGATGDDTFLDLYVALVTPAGIGINILGRMWYDNNTFAAGRGVDDQILLIAANGRFSVLGADWQSADSIASIEIVQGDKTIHLSPKRITTLPFLHSDGTPRLTERALVFVPGVDGLDPARPWQVRLLVPGETAAGKPVFADFTLGYRLPDSYLLQSAGAADDGDSGLAWVGIWRDRSGEIAVLGVALAVLTAILFLQAPISRRPRLHRWIRIGFLTWTLVWLGWYAGAQLTVVLVITWIHSLVREFRWDTVLADPLIAILLGFSIVSLFLWGRAAFCGWLCPFGALQELVNKAARQLRIPQFKIPVVLHTRLVVGKYVLFVALVVVSFFSWDLAMAGTEIEPFKAAIVLRFMTEWPMVAYALVLIAASLFVERFYCRFACPLGGGLAIFGKVRVFDSLKRHTECGTRCRACETICPVGAIKRNGQINMNECFYCLDCQVTYYDDHTCPPMVWRRKQLELRPQSSPLPATARARATTR